MSRTDQQLRRNRRREKKERARRLHATTHHGRFSGLPEGIELLSYRISFDPLSEPPEERDPLLEAALAEVREDIWNKVHDDPRSAIPALEKLLTRFPNAGMLLNWLASAQASAGETEKAQATARRNLEANPNYLFARINAASFRLHEGDIAGVEQILDNKFDLKLQYPDRDEFHVSEFLAFSALILKYWMHKGEFERARKLFDIMDQVAPDHETTRGMRVAVQGSYLLELARLQSAAALRRGYLPAR
jgi:tetratricopeptide (TPR) repeat protein